MNDVRAPLEARVLRERQVWIAAVAVLVTTTAWVSLAAATLVARDFAPGLVQLGVVARVLFGVALGLRRAVMPVLGAGAVGLALVALLLPRKTSRSIRNEVRHA